VIHADAGASHQSVVNVLEASRLAGLARVTFAAQATATAPR
jgi:biopolymer transport protein ExbD